MAATGRDLERKEKKERITPKLAKNKMKKMIAKLNGVKDVLLKWEDYFISFAKTYSILSNNFQSTF